MESTIIITGRLGADPETTDRGRGPVTRVSLAHPQGHYDNQARQWVEADTPTAWYKIAASGRTGEQLATMRKGAQVLVIGKLSVDVWTPQSGTRAGVGSRTDLQIWASSVAAVPATNQQQAAQAAPTMQAAPAATAATIPASSPWEAYTEPDF